MLVSVSSLVVQIIKCTILTTWVASAYRLMICFVFSLMLKILENVRTGAGV